MANNTGSDLAKLEYEFATNPNSEAFIPLAEAYLGMGRFVEAMVVCKKGIKAHPDLPTGRLIMARIYSDQAKHQKAVEELNKLLKLSPDNNEAFRLMGKIHLKLGREEEGVGFLKKALDTDPNDRESREALLKIGIDYVPSAAAPAAPAAAAPPAAAQPAAAPAAGPSATTTPEPVTERNIPQAPAPTMSEAPTQRNMPAAAAPAAPAQAPAAPAVAPRPAAPPRPQRKRIADIYQEMEDTKKKPAAGKGIKLTMYMGGALGVILIIYVIYTWQAGLKQEKINKYLEDGRLAFNQDSYTGYKKALDDYLAIYKLDSDHAEALARGAFVAAVLHGEYKETSVKIGDKSYKMIDKANEMLNKAISQKQTSNMLSAAQGLITLYAAGSANDAINSLETALKGSPDSPVLHTTLGLILIRKGSLDEARDHLERGAAQSDIRAFVGMGEWAMRKSMYQPAVRAYNRALGIDRGHIRSLLGKSLAALAWGDKLRHSKEALTNLQRFKSELAENAAAHEKTAADFIEAMLKVRNPKTRKSGISGLKAFLKKQSSQPVFQFIGARELRRNRRLKDAKETIGRALRLDGSRPDFLLEEALIYLSLRDYEAARSRAMRLQETDAACGRCILIIGDAYMGEKKLDQAKKAFMDATKLDDVAYKSEGHMRLAHLYNLQNEKDREQAQLELAIPGLLTSGERRLAAEASLRLAQTYAEKQRTTEFLKILKQAMAADETFAPPYCLLASNINIDSKDGRDQAKEMCSKCIEFDTGGQYSGGCKALMKRLR